MKKLKNIVVLLFIVVGYISCNSEDAELFDNSSNTSNELIEKQKDIVVDEANHYPTSTRLIYRGNNLWSGSVGPIDGYFMRPTQQQLNNGMRSSWEMTTPPIGYSWYRSIGVIEWGGFGNGFYAKWISLSVTGKRKKLLPEVEKSRKIINGVRTSTYKVGRIFTNGISLSDGGLKTFRGKIILDENCRPMIVSINSKMPSGCMQDDSNSGGGEVPD